MAITVSRMGAVNADTSTETAARDLFLKQYAGEVLTSFDETNVSLGRSQVREIEQGRSAQFPTIAKATAEYHSPGNEIGGQEILHDERTITIDDMLVSAIYVHQIDEAMTHYDVRSEYSTQQGRALARTADRQILVTGINAANMSASESPAGFEGGGTIDLGANTGLDNYVSALFEAAAELDNKDIPPEDRYFFVPPRVYYGLIQHDKALSTEYSEGNGDFAGARIASIAGFEIVKTNNLPATYGAANLNDGSSTNTYKTLTDSAYNRVRGLIWHRAAVGTVRLLDLSMEMEYQPTKQSTFMVAKYAMGHGVLRPDCAFAVSADDWPDSMSVTTAA